ncbi:MAG: efflux RND transporter permease subunit, partial [Bacteroidia bacterium]
MFRFFIKNPVFSSVIAIVIVICGLVAIVNLPLAEYPNIAPPTLTITAHYPGANARVLERTVASPIEDEINGATHMIYMNSTMSSNGEYNLVVTFATGTDLNEVIGDVLNRLNSALPILPDIVQQLGVTMRKSSQNLLMSISILSNGRYDNIYVSNYTYRTVYTELSRLKGVGDIGITGDRHYSMRIWLKPDKMAKLGIGVTDVANAIKDQNVQVAVGQTAAPPSNGAEGLSFNLNGQGYYSDPKQFENIIVRAESDNYIRIKDIARVELGALRYDTISKLNLTDNIGLQVYLDPSANQLAVHDLVIKTMDKLARQFPEGISYSVSFDNTKFIEKSLHNVADTLRDACILVIIVIFLFLQKGRATIIPILTIPVSIIGTFAGMYATNFSINNLTLFGIILSIGIVVDDSIVVIENVERLMRNEHLSARAASIKTMDEVSSALISIVLVLCCAFIPSAFLGGLTGILYRQFAITISMAVIISGITALTLTPALCAIMLKNSDNFEVTNKFFIWFNAQFERFTNFYIYLVKHLIKQRLKYMLVFGALLVVTVFIFWYNPVGFIPTEDKGFFTTQITLPNNATLTRSESVAVGFIKHLQTIPTIGNNIAMIGEDDLNAGAQKTNVATIISDLTDWDERKDEVDSIMDKVNKYGAEQKDANYLAYNQPAIDGLSVTNGVEFYIEDKVEGNYNELGRYLSLITEKLKQNNAVVDATYSFNAKNTEVQILADVDRAKLYGSSIADIYSVLETNFGPNLVNYFYIMGDLYWVTMEGDEKYRANPFQLNKLFVRGGGESQVLVPLGSVTKVSFTNAPDVIERFNDYLGAKVVVTPNPKYTTHQIMQIIDKVVTEIIPKSYDFSWYGVSYQQQSTSLSSMLAFVFGLVMIFLVLAAQFEMWRLPIVVIMGVPFALFGAGLVLLLRGLTDDLYFQISLITLLGLSAKNSILITEFALHHWKMGYNTIDAVLEASRKRFRPIIMTSLAFILGAMPLAFAHGANSNAEHSVGTGIIGGMLGSTFIATIFVPMFFVIIMRNKKYIDTD